MPAGAGLRSIRFPKEKVTIMHSGLQQQTDAVRQALRHAQHLFGGELHDPPAAVIGPQSDHADLERDLGCGRY